MCRLCLLVFFGTLLLVCHGLEVESSSLYTSKSCESPCRYYPTPDMMICSERLCKHFPRDLKPDAGNIYAPRNHIRKITKEDLKPYSKLEWLYLSNNLITEIQPDAFIDQDLLSALYLSNNSFASASAIPEVIFQLPQLNHLYLDHNPNVNIVEVIENAVPITAPLVHLDISFNQLDNVSWMRLPNLGVMPHLFHYSMNGMRLSLNVSQFAGLCLLTKLTNTNVSLQFENPCDCWNLHRWLIERQVEFEHFTDQCRIAEADCEYKISQDDMDVYNSCRKEIVRQVDLRNTLKRSNSTAQMYIKRGTSITSCIGTRLSEFLFSVPQSCLNATRKSQPPSRIQEILVCIGEDCKNRMLAISLMLHSVQDLALIETENKFDPIANGTWKNWKRFPYNF